MGAKKTPMAIENEMREKLEKSLAPTSLEVINESHKHAGHAGSPGTGESHFQLNIVSEAFSGKTRLERHRLINEVLKEELAGKIHALAINAKAPDETG